MLAMAEEARGHRKTAPSGEVRFGANQALCVYPSGVYRDFAAVGTSHGGRGGRALFAHLYPGKDPAGFLAAHPGLGDFTPDAAGEHDDEAEAEARAVYAKVLYGSAEENSPLVRRYLTQTRGLPLPPDIEARIRFFTDQRRRNDDRSVHARRFTRSLLNPGVEDAELRKFTETLEQIAERCHEQIIIDVITIWRWGRAGLRRGAVQARQPHAR